MENAVNKALWKSRKQKLGIGNRQRTVVDSPRPVARSPWSISAFCFPNFCFEHEFQHVSVSAFEFPGASRDGVFRDAIWSEGVMKS